MKKRNDYNIDISKIDVKYIKVIEKIINMNEINDMSDFECFENIYHFIKAFPNLSDEDYYRLSKYNYEEDWFCFLYEGVGNDIKKALDYCVNYSNEIEDMYLHYLIFNQYLGNDIKKKDYLYVNLENIKSLYDEAYDKMLKKTKLEEKLCVKIS